MIRYNKLAKVSAGETIQNELVVSKWVEESFHFGPRKSAWHCKSLYMSSAQGRFTSPDPVNLGARIRYPQTWNMYAYALNNPQRYVDPTGLWSTGIHNRIINAAFPGLSVSGRDSLKRVSAFQDHLFPGQSRHLSYQHSMRAPWETPQQAQAKLQQFAKERMEAAQILNSVTKAPGQPDLSALEVFGELLHAEVDGTSPSHEGFQTWHWGCPFAWMGCTGRSILQHKAQEATISPQRLDQAVRVARQWFLYTFGEAFYSQATKEPVGCVATSDSATGSRSKECK